LSSQATDVRNVWKKTCLQMILPNNQYIVDLIEKNKRHFPYPWDVYRAMLSFKTHVDSFRENCLSDERVNDYKQFPIDFDHFVKTKLGIDTPSLETRTDEEIDFRKSQIDDLISKFLGNHSA